MQDFVDLNVPTVIGISPFTISLKSSHFHMGSHLIAEKSSTRNSNSRHGNFPRACDGIHGDAIQIKEKQTLHNIHRCVSHVSDFKIMNHVAFAAGVGIKLWNSNNNDKWINMIYLCSDRMKSEEIKEIEGRKNILIIMIILNQVNTGNGRYSSKCLTHCDKHDVDVSVYICARASHYSIH